MKFPDIVHAGKPDPQTEMPQAQTAHDNFWDFCSWSPETMHILASVHTRTRTHRWGGLERTLASISLTRARH
jgi:catalase